jgi:sigma-54-like protein
MQQLSVGVEMTPKFGMAATPALVAYATMLALPGAELEQAVARELSENPALVQEEVDACGGCGLPGDRPCPYCGREVGRFRIPGRRPQARDHRCRPGQRACDVINQAERQLATDGSHYPLALVAEGEAVPTSGSTAALAGPGNVRGGHEAPASSSRVRPACRARTPPGALGTLIRPPRRSAQAKTPCMPSSPAASATHGRRRCSA